ncbi:hypothetical protein BS47DRAFT_1377211 [Hydnum rufescens UP504]|uniref:PX domain-containing protein n=1 Tax=Hydnum rufescens UP504 TaxID=1448309 RepID=A0A9P6AT38_9AGAM|nr:hypothetical protein BS47DRAFT_1377211 [Hydnum rufescens UP504]
MTSSYEEEPNPFSQDVGFDGVSGLSTPSVEHITFTPEGTTVESSQSTVNGQFFEGSRILAPPHIPGGSPASRPIGYKSEIDRYLHSGEDVEILVATLLYLRITDAVKTSDNSTSAYIVYMIRTGDVDTRRRYSDFESFRKGLVKLYPTLIVPPIPSKQTIGDYAVKQSKAKEDATMISRRKRMLQVFLNRLARHPILSTEYIFHRFLSADVSWSEILHSPPLSQLPKDILKAPAHNPLDSSSAIAYAALPSPSASTQLRNPDQRFLDSEVFTNRFASHLSGNMEKVTRRTMKRWSDYAHDNAELGAVLNGFSLSETGHLASALEKTGQAIDTTYISTARLLQDLEQTWTEPLHEYSQFAEIIKKLLLYRHQKHIQYEMTLDTLDLKREALEELEKSEAEARRLESALAAAGVRTKGASSLSQSQPALGSVGSRTEAIDDEPEYNGVERNGVPEPLPPPPLSSARRTKSMGGGLLSALSHSLQGMMDVDPEAARRNAISKTRDAISHLEDAQHLSAQDLKYASSTIQADLDRFQRQKVADLREMALAMARIHRDWCQANLEAWEAAKVEMSAIEAHPNQPPREESTRSDAPGLPVTK